MLADLQACKPLWEVKHCPKNNPWHGSLLHPLAHNPKRGCSSPWLGGGADTSPQGVTHPGLAHHSSVRIELVHFYRRQINDIVRWHCSLSRAWSRPTNVKRLNFAHTEATPHEPDLASGSENICEQTIFSTESTEVTSIAPEMPDWCMVLQGALYWRAMDHASAMIFFSLCQTSKWEKTSLLASATSHFVFKRSLLPKMLSDSLFLFFLPLIGVAACGLKKAFELSWLNGIAFYLPALQSGKKESDINKSLKGWTMPWVVHRTEFYFWAVPGTVFFKISLTAV